MSRSPASTFDTKQSCAVMSASEHSSGRFSMSLIALRLTFDVCCFHLRRLRRNGAAATCPYFSNAACNVSTVSPVT